MKALQFQIGGNIAEKLKLAVNSNEDTEPPPQGVFCIVWLSQHDLYHLTCTRFHQFDEKPRPNLFIFFFCFCFFEMPQDMLRKQFRATVLFLYLLETLENL